MPANVVSDSTSVPDAPGCLPLTGHYWPVWRGLPTFIQRCAEAGPVQRIRLGPRTLYLLNDVDLVQQVLVDDASSYHRPAKSPLRDVFGENLFYSEGAAHRTRRKLLHPPFSGPRLREFMPVAQQSTRRLIESWSPGDRLVIHRRLLPAVLDCMVRELCGAELPRDALGELEGCFQHVLDGIRLRTTRPLWWSSLPTPTVRRYRSALSTARRLTEDMVDLGRHDSSDGADVLSLLLSARDHHTGEPLTRQQVAAQLLELFGAGVEATSMIMAWALHELSHNPHVERLVHEEVDRRFGDGSTTIVHPDDLPYTHRVVKEAQRRTGVMFFNREAVRDTEVGGYAFAPGTQVLISPYVLHHNPRLYPDPTRFDPDRWLPERAEGLPRGAFIPFGNGGHRCIGASMSTAFAVATVATIARRWRLRPVAGRRVQEVAGLTLRPDDTPVVVHPRRPPARHTARA